MGIKFSREDRLWKEANQEGWWRFQTPRRYIFFLALAIVIIVGVWFLFSPNTPHIPQDKLPLIEPLTPSYKVKVDDSQVTSVPHQDKLIYGRLTGEATSQTVEHILPTPEIPQKPIEPEVLATQEASLHPEAAEMPEDASAPLKMTTLYTPSDEAETAPAASLHKASSITDLLEEVVDDPISSLIKTHGEP